MQNLLWVMIAAYILGACGAWVAGRRELGRWLTAIGAGVGSAAAFSLGLSALLAPAVPPLTWVSGTSVVSLAVRLDGLGAFFLVTVGLIGLAAAIYGFNYSAAYAGRYSLGRLGFLFNLLLLTLCLQVMADNAFTFLFLWEVMSLAAYGLVLTEADQEGAVRSAGWYIGVTHVGFAALVAMFLLLAGSDLTTSFEAVRCTPWPDSTAP